MIYVNITYNGVTRYPKHKHSYSEIMLYLEGEGYMYCKSGNLPFSQGTIIIMPSNTLHGSVSQNGFKNISIGGDTESLLMITKPIAIKDNDIQEHRRLAEILLETTSDNEYYQRLLFEAYVSRLMQMIKIKSDTFAAVEKITEAIKNHAFDSEINLTEVLNKSGYAEDYIRDRFKAFMGMTPNKFLTKTRMERARYLIDIYGNTLSLAQIAERCGYTDYIYFSRKFKERYGMSPTTYNKLQ